MLTNRISAYFEEPVLALSMETDSAFVPCCLCQIVAPQQQSSVLEIYRIAAERAEADLRGRRVRVLQFSGN
jgi:hypothetical protein